MDEFKRSNFIFAIVNVIIVLLIFILLPSVSAVPYSVNSSCSSDYIQNLIYTDDITELHFSNVSGRIFEGIVLDIYKNIIFTCDNGVVFNGMNSSNYAFNILSDNVTVVGFGFVGYFAGIVADNVNNLSIVNNTFNIGIEGVG